MAKKARRSSTKVTKKFRAKPGAKFSQADAKIIGRELEKLGSEVTPKQLIAAAKPARSPLHKYFTWNLNRAAQKQWLAEARHLLNHISVMVVIAGGKEEETRMFHNVHVHIDEPKQYVHVTRILHEADLQKQVVQEATDSLQSWYSRYLQYERLFGKAMRHVKLALKALEKVA